MAGKSRSVLGSVIGTIVGMAILVAIVVGIRIYIEGMSVLSSEAFRRDMIGIAGGSAGVLVALLIIGIVLKLFEKRRL